MVDNGFWPNFGKAIACVAAAVACTGAGGAWQTYISDGPIVDAIIVIATGVAIAAFCFYAVRTHLSLRDGVYIGPNDKLQSARPASPDNPPCKLWAMFLQRN